MIVIDKIYDRLLEKELNDYVALQNLNNEEQVFNAIYDYLVDKYDHHEKFLDYNIKKESNMILFEKYDGFEGRHCVIDLTYIEIDSHMKVLAYKLNDRRNKPIIKLESACEDEIIRKCKNKDGSWKDIDLYRSCPPEERGKLSMLLMEKNNPSFSNFDKVIPAYSFYNYDREFIVPGGELKGKGGFLYREYVKSEIVEIPFNIIGIEEHAFDGCNSLKEIYIHPEVCIIEKKAFANCPNLTVVCAFNEKPEGWDDEWCDESCKVIWTGSKKIKW